MADQMMWNRKSCHSSESAAMATHTVATRIRMCGVRGFDVRDFCLTTMTGVITSTKPATTVNGFARIAPTMSRCPSRTAAVVEPQIGQGIPVIARNGHNVAGLPGMLKWATSKAAPDKEAARTTVFDHAARAPETGYASRAGRPLDTTRCAPSHGPDSLDRST